MVTPRPLESTDQTYAHLVGLIERIINAKTVAATRDHALGDVVGPDAGVGCSDEALRHPEALRHVQRAALDALTWTIARARA